MSITPPCSRALQVSIIGNNGFNGLNDFAMMGGDYERHEAIPHPPRVGARWIQCHRVGQVRASQASPPGPSV